MRPDDLGSFSCKHGRVPTPEAFAASNAKRIASSLARDLRRAADDIDRVARGFDSPGAQSYATVAGDIQQQVLTTVVTAGLGELTQAASEADVARATTA